MDDSFRINNTQNSDNKEITYFTLIGKHKKLDSDKNPILDKESDLSYAKKIIVQDKARYYVKVGTYNKIYNPIGMYSEGTSNKFLARAGKKAWDYKEVNQKVFDMYITFLRTKNIAWLNNAEREMN